MNKPVRLPCGIQKVTLRFIPLEATEVRSGTKDGEYFIAKYALVRVKEGEIEAYYKQSHFYTN